MIRDKLPSIPTPIPQTVVDLVRMETSGGVLMILWRAVVTVVVLTVLVTLAAFGGGIGLVATVVTFLAVSVLRGDYLKAILTDIWNFDFYEI
jgi:hypothetical protein